MELDRRGRDSCRAPSYCSGARAFSENWCGPQAAVLGVRPGHSRMGGLIMAQGWTWPLEKILAELVQLFQVVKSRDQSGLPQVLGFGMWMPREGREVGNISIGLMENGRVVQGRVFL